MAGCGDTARGLSDAIEALTATIAMNEREERFFRRSSDASTQESSKAVFLEVADHLSACRQRLEADRKRLEQVLTRTK